MLNCESLRTGPNPRPQLPTASVMEPHSPRQRSSVRPAPEWRRSRRAGFDLQLLTRQAAAAARMLKLIGNERRLLILCFLAANGEMRAGELMSVAGLSQSALSQHLAKMRADGLVAFRRESQTLHYRISDPRAARISTR